MDNTSEFGERKPSFVRTSHPDFPGRTITHEPEGKNYESLEREGGGRREYITGPYLLENFSIDSIVANKEKPLDEMLASVQPLQLSNKRFYNVDALAPVTETALLTNPANLNADLGTQRRIRLMTEKGILDEHTFVLVTHGHFVAGLAELTRALTPDNKYMFDTTIFYPGQGTEASSDAISTVRDQLQLWSEQIQQAKDEHKQQNRAWAGGIAIGLDGHRNRSHPRAPIDPAILLGNSEEFSAFLRKHNLDKVVILTEEPATDADIINDLPLDRLKYGAFGHENFDLHDYFKNVGQQGIDVTVVSANTRPPHNHIGRERARIEQPLIVIPKKESITSRVRGFMRSGRR